MISALGIRRILLATDLGPDSQNAIAFGHHLTRQVEGRLFVLSVLSPGREEWGALRERKLKLDQATSAASLDGVEVTAEARVGRPDEEIVEYARQQNIDLIVLGTRGRSRWTKAIAGSIAEQVIRNAHCPVAIVPPWQASHSTDQLDEAVRRLSIEFGPGLVGDEIQSRSRMTAFLARTFELTESDVRPLLGQLESSGAIRWHDVAGEPGAPGNRFWSIRPEPAAAFHRDEPPLTADSDSLALNLLRRAIHARASDIHLDPSDHDQFQVRFRIDGRVESFCRFDRGIALSIIQQFKVLAGLDIADPFKPQEGGLRLPPGLEGHEVRLTSAPVRAGQAVALRLFSGERILKPIEGLGLSGRSLEAVQEMLARGSGLVLGTGSTGSGKTTLIYSLLNCLASSAKNIVSVEDPIEFPLPFVRQIAVDPRHGVTMTSGLRTLLRMDPDIVFLGEIRDPEAAETAMRAGSAGRFVFSTLHTRSIASTITAIRDLHIDNRSLAANLTGIVSQRLVRRLCSDCCQRTATSEAEVAVFEQHGVTAPAFLSRATGCERCRQTGYRDRIGVFEAVRITPELQERIVEGVPEVGFEQLIREVCPSLLADGLSKVSVGLTSLDEVLNMYRIE